MNTRPALAIAAGIILAVFFTAGLLAPVLAPYDLEAMDLTARLLMPFESAAHILGTDELGRDIFSRLLYSIRMSFVLAVVGTLLGAVIGTLLGFLAARFGASSTTPSTAASTSRPRSPSSSWPSRSSPSSAPTSPSSS